MSSLGTSVPWDDAFDLIVPGQRHERGLAVRRIVRATVGAMDFETVNLLVISMEQNGAALLAGVIDRVGAGDQDRRRAHDRSSGRRCPNGSQADFAALGHDSLHSGGSVTALSVTDACRQSHGR